MSNESIAQSTNAVLREQRREDRKPVGVQIEVTDANTGLFVGYLVNISSEGIMLVGETEIAPSSVFQFRVPLPESAGEVTELLLGVESLWCQPGEDPNHYWCGFHIIDISPGHRQALAELIASL